MYILTTTTGIKIKVDGDELERLAKAPLDELVFLRNGAVMRRMVATILADENRREETLRLPGETDEELEKRIEEDKSDDIFAEFRSKILSAPHQLKLPEA